jgi:peptidoglycan-N-acetylglucosamine deacetylase
VDDAFRIGRRRVAAHSNSGVPVNPRPKKVRLLRLLPRFLLTTEASADGNAMYLTFDDGPHPEITPRVLDVLKRHGAHASFFMVGSAAEARPDIVRRIADEGHLVGNHSYDHPRFTRISLAEQLGQIDHADRILSASDGKPRHLFRPPSGALPLSLMFDFLRKRRRIAYWSYDTLDYRREPKDRIVERLRTTPPIAGDVLLMHDDDERIVHVLEDMLPEWRAAGFEMRALPEEKA